MTESADDDPYKAPQTPLDTEPDAYLPRIFTLRGRIGRARFMAYTWWVTMVIMVTSVPLLAVLGGSLADVNNPFMMSYAFLLGVLVYVPLLVMVKRRLNVLDLSGWLAAVIFMPFLNVLLMLYIACWPGDPGANRFGPPPQANSVWVILFGVVLPLFFLISVFVGLLLPLLLGEAAWYGG